MAGHIHAHVTPFGDLEACLYVPKGYGECYPVGRPEALMVGILALSVMGCATLPPPSYVMTAICPSPELHDVCVLTTDVGVAHV